MKRTPRISTVVTLFTLVVVVTLTIPLVAISPTPAQQAQAVAQAAQTTQQSSPTVDAKCLELVPAAAALGAWETATNPHDHLTTWTPPTLPTADYETTRQAMHDKRFPQSKRESMRQQLAARKQATKIQQLKVQATPPPESMEPGIIYGRVLLPDGTPAVEAYIWLYPLDEEGYPIEDWVDGYLTDSEGIFGIDMLDVGDYSLKVEPPDTSSGLLTLEDIEASIGYPEAWVDVGDLTLQQAAKTIDGSVKRDGTTPLANVTVAAFNLDTWQFITTKTDSTGHYAIGVGGGYWELEVLPAPAIDWVFADAPQLVLFAEDESTETETVDLIVLTADGYITGRVLDPQGNPITFTDPYDPNPEENTSASIDVWNTANDSFSYAYLHPDTGTFRVPLVAGVYEAQVWVDSYHAPYQFYGAPILDIVEVSTDEVSLGDIRLLPKNSVIKGTVKNEQGQGVAGVWVDVWQEYGEWDYTETDASGHYSMTVVAGAWLVEPSVPDESDYIAQDGITEVRVVERGEETIDFYVQKAAGRIQGTVVDANGTRLRDIDAWAYARSGESPTGKIIPALRGGVVSVDVVSSGRFSLKVPAGEMYVGLYVAPGSDYSFTTEAVSNQLEDVKIVLKPNDSIIAGKLVDTQGNPIIKIQGNVFVSPVGNSTAWQWAPINPSDGSYRLPIAAGEWLISYELLTDHYVPYPPEDLTVTTTSNQTTTQDFTLTALDGMIQGQVLDEEGQPRATTYVWVGNDRYSTYVLTDDQGRFVVYVPAEQETSPISPTLSADMSALRGYTVQTAVKNCKLRYRGTTLIQCVRDAIKQTSRPRVRTSLASAEDEAALSQTTDVTLVVRGANAYLVGQVFDANNTPVVGAFIDAYSDDDQNGNAVSDANGCFLLEIAHDETNPTTWKINAAYQDTQSMTWWSSGYQSLSTQEVEPLLVASLADSTLARTSRLQAPLVLKSIANKLQAPEMHKFKVANGWSYTLPDGTHIQIPANAVPTNEEWVQIAIAPTVYLPDNGIYRKVNNGYTITLYEARSGKKITQKLKADAVLSFSYATAVQTGLMALGTDVATLQPAQYQADTWQPNQSYTHNTQVKRINVQTRRFGIWCLVQAQPSLVVEPTQTPFVFLPLVQRVQ